MPKGKYEYFPTANQHADNLPDEKLLELKNFASDGFQVTGSTNCACEICVELPPTPRYFH